MKVIGLCGGSGSGKGTVCDIFREKGILCIDTDAVYRDLTGRRGPLLNALKREFGKEIITDDNALNRRALASIVFSSENADLKLNDKRPLRKHTRLIDGDEPVRPTKFKVKDYLESNYGR